MINKGTKVFFGGILIASLLAGEILYMSRTCYAPKTYETHATLPFARSICKGKVVDLHYTTRDHFFYFTCATEKSIVEEKHNFNEIGMEFLEGI